jgi:predicted PurR-regulated permease PerM
LGESAWGRRVIAQANPEALMDSEVVQRVGGWITSALGMLATTIIILAFGVYYAISPSLYIDSALRLAPSARRERLGDVIGHIGAALRSWLAGRFISMVLVAGGTWLGLEFIGVPIALALGFLAGALSFVPNVGPILGSIPGIIVALSVSPMTAVWAAVVYVSVQAVESYAITPFIEFRAVSLPPGFLLAVQLLLGLLAGILGLFLATPLAVVAVVALQMLYLQDVLGEDVTLLDDHSGHDRSEAAH